jgi:hypothetical protein
MAKFTIDIEEHENIRTRKPPHFEVPKWLEKKWWWLAVLYLLLVSLLYCWFPLCGCFRFRPEWQELILLVLPIFPLLLLIFPMGKFGPYETKDYSESEAIPSDPSQPAGMSEPTSPTTEPVAEPEPIHEPENGKEADDKQHSEETTEEQPKADEEYIRRYESAMDDYKKGEWVRATQKLENMARENPSDINVTFILGFLFGEGGPQQELYKAIFYSELALLSSEGNYPANMNLGLAIYHDTPKEKKDRLEYAQYRMQMAIRLLRGLDDKNSRIQLGKCHLFAGLIHKKISNYLGAEIEFHSAISELDLMSKSPEAAKWLKHAKNEFDSIIDRK